MTQPSLVPREDWATFRADLWHASTEYYAKVRIL
jgi:hypothetical protein